MSEWLKKICGQRMGGNRSPGRSVVRAPSIAIAIDLKRCGDRNFFAGLIATLLLATLAACVTTPTRARFNHYTLQVVASNANQVLCRYGEQRVANYQTIPLGESRGAGSDGYWVVHPELTCRWLAADGTPRQEAVPMEKLLLPPYITWDKLEGQIVRDVPPIQGSPNVLVEIKDRTIRVVIQARIRLEGEWTSPSTQRIRIQEITRVLHERHGTEGAAP